MKIGVLGTGMVGHALATKLVDLGHDVMMGSRSAVSETAKEWLSSVNGEGRIGTFHDAAAHGEMLVLATKGHVAIDVLQSCDTAALSGKPLIDITNPLDFSKGMPPTLFVCNDDSLGEQIQRAFPQLKVVKALNTLNCNLMVEPSLLKGPHDLFICGNDEGAKAQVTAILGSFGWREENIHDLGDITNARGTEQILPLWIRMWKTLETPAFNFHIER